MCDAVMQKKTRTRKQVESVSQISARAEDEHRRPNEPDLRNTKATSLSSAGFRSAKHARQDRIRYTV